MTWVIETLNATVDRELDSLPPESRARLVRICELIEEFGLEQMGRPHIRQVRGPIWEIRIWGRSGPARALCVVGAHERLVIVRAFRKKSRRTPHEIQLAERRARDILR